MQAFVKHITEFTDLKQIALSKGLGQNAGVTLADDEATREPGNNEAANNMNDVAVNFLSKSMSTQSGRVITLSHRALASYQ